MRKLKTAEEFEAGHVAVRKRTDRESGEEANDADVKISCFRGPGIIYSVPVPRAITRRREGST